MSGALPRLAVTGGSNGIGAALVRCLGQRTIPIVGSDPRRPPSWPETNPFRAIDLNHPQAATRLSEWWSAERVEAVVHTAFRSDPSADAERDRALEVAGTERVLRACVDAGIQALVVASSTMLYGPRPDNPLYLEETHPLRGHPDAHCIANRIAVEGAVSGWRQRHPGVAVTVLRSGWMLGPRTRSRVVSHFSRESVPVLLGYDPLMQLIHEDDCARVYEAALRTPQPGVYNLVGRGVLPLRVLLRLGRQRALPLPRRVWYRVGDARERARSGDSVAAFYDYLRYPWVADGNRAWSAFGEPRYTTRETWMSLHGALRLGVTG